MFYVVVFVVFLPSHALPFSVEEGEGGELIKAEMKRAGGRPKRWPVITKEKSQIDIETECDFVDSNALHFGQPGFFPLTVKWKIHFPPYYIVVEEIIICR